MTMENGSQPLIRLDAVSKVFVTDEVETHALQSIHFDVKKGEYLSISGPSGCGKSTLLAILGLLDTPTDGTYYLNGKSVTGLKLSERARIRNREIGFIFQAFNLIGDLTVYENVELPLTYRGMPSAERKRRVQEALERVGMSHRMKHYPSQLPGGQQQRVAVARALSRHPLILLADEPTGSRDSANREPVRSLLRELHATRCWWKPSRNRAIQNGWTTPASWSPPATIHSLSRRNMRVRMPSILPAWNTALWFHAMPTSKTSA